MVSIAKIFCIFVFFSITFANENEFYGIGEIGAQKEWAKSNDNLSKVHKTLGVINLEGGYRFSQWQLGILFDTAGMGPDYGDTTGIPLIRGANSVPIHAHGSAAINVDMGFKVGYKILHNTNNSLYANLILLNAMQIIPTKSAVTPILSAGGLKLEIEGKRWMMPQWGLGYRLGGLYLPSSTFVVVSDGNFVKFPKENMEIEGKSISGIYGDVKLLHRYNDVIVFLKWSIDARFISQSQTLTTTATNPKTQADYGELSLHIPKYHTIRSAIALGFEF